MQNSTAFFPGPFPHQVQSSLPETTRSSSSGNRSLTSAVEGPAVYLQPLCMGRRPVGGGTCDLFREMRPSARIP